MVNNLELIAEGRVNSAVSTAEPRSAREAARDIVANRNRNEVLLCEDFEMVAQWMKSRNPPADGDAIRARLVKRRTLLQAALPTSLSGAVSKAFATVERECLQKQYANSTTMTTLEPIASIPRDAFFVSEDNYAWDMEELVQALACNGGVMRNPLSRDLFSNADIEAILDHPMGRQLRPMQEAQHRMQHGFRPSTVAWISKLGSILLNEQSSDAASSRAAIDEFLAYMATLPAAERQAVDALKIAASDGHTGQAYDYTVGDSVRDAKMNTTCFHKVGDFLAQAASYLGRR
ncbi:hypothetical protein EJ04DRAFT_430542 [Polyplosphaeria fusca]|uniref:Uncharacterized protein n=1 Tax=Polyplosphaeria fusca TaxID=682080 RepID=A0A9P4R728_9PLEO|nr:hypothetical protein EJ04DRAFT_430542 [Polyplosphaeria fusca]